MGIVMQATVTRVAILLRHKDINHRPGAQAPYLAYLCALALVPVLNPRRLTVG